MSGGVINSDREFIIFIFFNIYLVEVIFRVPEVNAAVSGY